jgi:putative ABC transport system ATP-binding protein
LDQPTAGRVTIGGTQISGLSDSRLTALRRERIGFVFQAFNLLPTLTAWENITLPLDLAGLAAMWPARRAARTDMLTAIATD